MIKTSCTIIALLLVGLAWTGEGQDFQRTAIFGSEHFKHDGEVKVVAVSPDGKYFVSSAGDRTLIFWDSQSGKKLRTLTDFRYAVVNLAFSPDGNYLLLEDTC